MKFKKKSRKWIWSCLSLDSLSGILMVWTFRATQATRWPRLFAVPGLVWESSHSPLDMLFWKTPQQAPWKSPRHRNIPTNHEGWQLSTILMPQLLAELLAASNLGTAVFTAILRPLSLQRLNYWLLKWSRWGCRHSGLHACCAVWVSALPARWPDVRWEMLKKTKRRSIICSTFIYHLCSQSTFKDLYNFYSSKISDQVVVCSMVTPKNIAQLG